MKIRTLDNKLFNVELEELYIKPEYAGDKVISWCICTNQRNEEIILGSYSKKEISSHMLNILRLCSYADFEMELVPEVRICQDLYLQAAESLKRANLAYLKGIVK